MATIRLINRAAHIKHILLGGGQEIRLPVTETDTPLDVTADSAAELERLELALATETVKQWVEQGELVIVRSPVAAEPTPAPEPAAPVPVAAPSEPPAPEPSRRSTRGKRDEED